MLGSSARYRGEKYNESIIQAAEEPIFCWAILQYIPRVLKLQKVKYFLTTQVFKNVTCLFFIAYVHFEALLI